MILAHSTDLANAEEEITYGGASVGFADEEPHSLDVGSDQQQPFIESPSELMFLQNEMATARSRVLEAAVGASECLIYREHGLNQFGFKSTYKLFLIYERPHLQPFWWKLSPFSLDTADALVTFTTTVNNEATKAPDWTIIKIRPETREKYERVRRLKRLKFVEVADLAIDALLRTDPELKHASRLAPAAA